MYQKKILVLEHDLSDWKSSFQRLKLNDITDKYEIIPWLDDLEGTLNWIEEEDLSKYDIVLLDIFYWSNTSLFNEKSSSGEAYVILEMIRNKAPWLPVIAYTQHIDQGQITYDLSLRKFDTILPKSLIRDDSSFCEERFDQIIQNAIRNRHSIVQNQEFFPSSFDPNELLIEMDSYSSDYFYNYFNERELKTYLSTIFPIQRKIIITRLSEGYSGNRVFHLSAWSSNQRFGKESHWVLKCGKDANDLCEEVRAYREVQLGGLHHSVYAPLLHHGVIHENGIASICYQLEDKVFNYYEYLKNNKADQAYKAIDLLFEILMELFGETSTESGISSEHWLSREKFKRIITNCSKEVDVPDMLKDDDVINNIMNQRCYYHRGLIHGDLHSRNILINKTGSIILIDFAYSQYGPIAYDVAKLETDLLVQKLKEKNDLNAEKIISEHFFINSELKSDKIGRSIKRIRKKLIESYNKITKEEWLFACLKAALNYASYPDVPEKIKTILITRVCNIVNVLSETK